MNPEQAAPTAVRLVFEFEGRDMRLVRQVPVDVAPSRFVVPGEALPGEHVEVRSADEGVISRVPVRSGMTSDREVFPENHDDPIVRTELPEAAGAFTVVVPVSETADHVSVVRIRGGRLGDVESGGRIVAPVPAEPDVVELGSFPLDRGPR